MIDAVTATTLIPGSVWARERDGEETTVTVLLVTNESLSPKLLARHPMQVVFLTQNQKVQSMTVEQFVANRNFKTMDVEREGLIKVLINGLEDEDDGEEIDIDAIELPTELTQASPAVDTAAEQNATDLKLKVYTESVPFFNADVDSGTLLLLTNHFASYGESPATGEAQGDTVHNLRFRLSDTMGLKTLRRVFDVSAEGASEWFQVNTPAEALRVDIDGFIDVFLEVVAPMHGNPSQTFGLVQVTSSGSFRAKQEASTQVAEPSQSAPSDLTSKVPANETQLIDLSADVAPPTGPVIEVQVA